MTNPWVLIAILATVAAVAGVWAGIGWLVWAGFTVVVANLVGLIIQDLRHKEPW